MREQAKTPGTFTPCKSMGKTLLSIMERLPNGTHVDRAIASTAMGAKGRDEMVELLNKGTHYDALIQALKDITHITTDSDAEAIASKAINDAKEKRHAD